MGMVFGDIFCCYPFLLDSVQRVGPGTSTQGLHSCIPLLSVRVSSLCSPEPSLCLTKHGIRAFVFLFEFFLAQKSYASHSGEGSGCIHAKLWLRHLLRNGYQVYAYWIRLRFYPFRVQHALVIYTLLPVRIKTSNIDAAQRPGEIQETHAAGPRIRKIL